VSANHNHVRLNLLHIDMTTSILHSQRVLCEPYGTVADQAEVSPDSKRSVNRYRVVTNDHQTLRLAWADPLVSTACTCHEYVVW